ncbi:MAG: hypothetical protein R3Y28_07815 [Candidatus Gastranaerophilales bacterium]
MEVSHYNLSGGINTSLTKTELGLDTSKLYWSDSKNIEIYSNRGITKQKGNQLFYDLGNDEAITGLNEMNGQDRSKLLITTISGKMYVYDDVSNNLSELEQTLTGTDPRFVNFLNGTVVTTESDGLFYVKEDSELGYEVVDCELKDYYEETVTGCVLGVYNGRIFAATGSTIYYAALGSYNDFTTDGDAGYIRDFHTDTDDITALKPYKDYLAIYKRHKVYLLSGVTEDDFTITAFADKGSYSSDAILNVENKQYFLSNGIYALEQVGELNQIRLGSEITSNIKPLFTNFSNDSLEKSYAIHYEKRNQIWYFFKFIDDDYFHTIWIYDYVNKAWYKRVVPQDLTCATLYNDEVLSADSSGKIYKEDSGTTFNGDAISFYWQSPFLAITKNYQRKTIDEFYFMLDNEYDNDFYFKVYKDYDNTYSDDAEHIYSIIEEHLYWDSENGVDYPYQYWGADDSTTPIWSISKEATEKAEISESNYSIQIHVEGYEATSSCTIIGLNFKEIYNDD